MCNALFPSKSLTFTSCVVPLLLPGWLNNATASTLSLLAAICSAHPSYPAPAAGSAPKSSRTLAILAELSLDLADISDAISTVYPKLSNALTTSGESSKSDDNTPISSFSAAAKTFILHSVFQLTVCFNPIADDDVCCYPKDEKISRNYLKVSPGVPVAV